MCIYAYEYVYMCVCVCVREKERACTIIEREHVPSLSTVNAIKSCNFIELIEIDLHACRCLLPKRKGLTIAICCVYVMELPDELYKGNQFP